VPQMREPDSAPPIPGGLSTCKVLLSFSTVAKLATVAALCVPFVAQADKSASSASSALTGQRSSLVTFSPGASTDFVFDVTGIGSWDSQGSATNETRTLNIGANAHVIGIGWDVNLVATAPSWLSELVVSFGATSSSFINLTAGIGDDFSGASNYTSGGVIDLVGSVWTSASTPTACCTWSSSRASTTRPA
jgi:hypothetical protein